MPTVALVIPFRDRGLDPLRAANLERVLTWWEPYRAPVHVVDDGRTGEAQFNRSAAYNRGRIIAGDPDVIVYTEADMLIPFRQIDRAISLAVERPGLVVGFTTYRYLGADDSERVRRGEAEPADVTPESITDGGTSIGAVNVVSRRTLDLVGGYTERTEGSWWDDVIMHRAMDVCAGPTRWVSGPGHHLYHQPGWTGDHLSDADRAATARNEALWQRVKRVRSARRMRALLHGADERARA